MKQFYTIAQLSNKQSLTPEGYLLCEEVPIARTGDMVYGGVELQNEDGTPVITPDPDGLVRIVRSPREVFRPETLASFNGKSVTDDHPVAGSVTPVTWKELTVGLVLNVRRGSGAQDDLMLADLLITTPEAIEAVRAGKREVSCGYEADYKETSPGVGEQENIVGNHVALVESGRCGWRCAIGDRKFKEKEMAKRSWIDRAMAAFKSQDEEGLKEALKEGETKDEGNEEATHIHIHGQGETPAPAMDDDTALQEHIAQNSQEHQEFRDRLDAIEAKLGEGETPSANDDKETEGQLEEEAPVGTGDRARKATDSAYLADSYRDTIALAEIIAPGIKVPTFDHKAAPKVSFKNICGLRRQALDLAFVQPATRSLVEEVMGGKQLDTKKMSCDAIRTIFKAVGAMKKAINTDATRGQDHMGHSQEIRTSRIQSVADIGKVWAEDNAKKFN